jgi:putative RecB family exonuclease
MINDIQNLWTESWNVSKGDIDLTGARVGGRATKANPNKEDETFWHTTGPKWVENYINWRKANPNWKIWVAPDGNPAIELGLTPVVAGVPIKMFIDRVFEVDGQLVIVDLKTSQQTPTSSLQLGFYKLGIEQTFGVEVNWGNYYMSRGSNTVEMIDLKQYSYDKMEYLVKQFDTARKAGVFLPNTNNCQYRCGLTAHCQFSTKKENI